MGVAPDGPRGQALADDGAAQPGCSRRASASCATFKLPGDPAFVGKVRDIVGLYLSPPDCAPVLCVDEKSQIQAPDRTRSVLPATPGMVERRTHDYRRNGTTSPSAALDISTGFVIGECYKRHWSRDLLMIDSLSCRRQPARGGPAAGWGDQKV